MLAGVSNCILWALVHPTGRITHTIQVVCPDHTFADATQLKIVTSIRCKGFDEARARYIMRPTLGTIPGTILSVGSVATPYTLKHQGCPSSWIVAKTNVIELVMSRKRERVFTGTGPKGYSTERVINPTGTGPNGY